MACPACEVPPPLIVSGQRCLRQISTTRTTSARDWENEADGLDLVHAGVGRVERARHAIEPDLALDRRLEVPLQHRDVH